MTGYSHVVRNVCYQCLLSLYAPGLVDEDDLPDVIAAVAKLAGRWKNLGISLGIHASELDTINSASDGLREMLMLWLKQSYNVRTIIFIFIHYTKHTSFVSSLGWRNPLAYINIQNLYRVNKLLYITHINSSGVYPWLSEYILNFNL